MIELQQDDTHRDRKVVPVNTGKVQIGRCWTPKPTPTQAQWIERHTRRTGGRLWLALSGVALMAAAVIAWKGA